MAQHKLQLSSSPLNETDVQDLETSYDNLFFKFILIGDAGTIFFFPKITLCKLGVGKTALLQRYIENKFNKDYHVTVGGEFASKFVNIDESTRIKLQIWDIVPLIESSFSNKAIDWSRILLYHCENLL